MNYTRQARSMREINLALPDLHHQFVVQEATDCGVSESEVVALALTLLALHRQTERAGGGLFLTADPSRRTEDLSISIGVVAAPELEDMDNLVRQVGRSLRLGLDTLNGDDGPHLRLV